MRADKKKERALAKVAELLGIDVAEVKAKTAPTSDTQEVQSNEAEAALAFYSDRGKGWQQKSCKWCERTFMSQPHPSIAYCSNRCRAKSLDEIGILWHPNKSEAERWEGKVPLVVPPAVLPLLQEALLPQYEQLEFPLDLQSMRVPVGT